MNAWRRHARRSRTRWAPATSPARRLTVSPRCWRRHRRRLSLLQSRPGSPSRASRRAFAQALRRWTFQTRCKRSPVRQASWSPRSQSSPAPSVQRAWHLKMPTSLAAWRTPMPTTRASECRSKSWRHCARRLTRTTQYARDAFRSTRSIRSLRWQSSGVTSRTTLQTQRCPGQTAPLTHSCRWQPPARHRSKT